MIINPSVHRAGGGDAAGFTLVELLISMGITVAIMGATLAGLTIAVRSNETALLMVGMNNGLRTGMDLMGRDMLQVGSGLPTGHVILTPSGVGSSLIRLPGPPGTAFTNVAGDTDISAVLPGPGLGPVVNGVATDMITVLTADNNFTDVGLTAVTSTYVDVDPAVNIAAGPDRVLPGQLILIDKGSVTTLVQVTSVNTGTQRVNFAAGDSLNLNQPGAASGNLLSLNATAPANSPASTFATRVRMISYYLDTVIPGRPRLVRRINNGHETTFNNTLGTAVALDIENLQFTYDLADGVTNPSNVRFTAADLNGSGACNPNQCSVNQIRKVNIVLSGRSQKRFSTTNNFLRNVLTSQVSLRGMAFVDEYLPPQ